MAADDRQWRIDPMTGFLNPEELTETHTVRAFTNFNRTGIQLDEGILYESPSSVSIPGYIEVPKGTTPSIGEFRVDYDPLKQDGTAITNPRHLNTGFIEFSDDALGNSVTVSYKGTGLIVKPSNIASLLDQEDLTPNDINASGNLDVAGTTTFAGNVLNAVPQVAVFTSSGTWTVPAGVTKCYVKVIGGGGGGRYSVNTSGSSTNIGGGGGGGGISEKLITGLTPGAGITVTVGAGGAGGQFTGPVAPGDGGTSSFGAYCSASGGTGAPIDQAAGNGGIGSGGDLNYSLGDGQGGAIFTTGGSAATFFMNGGTGGGPGGKGVPTANGQAGKAYGGGGGGGFGNTGTNTDYDGGAGAAGAVIIWY